MTVDFAFFHVGEDLTLPTMLVDSIKKTNPYSKIIQLTDFITPQVNFSDEIQRFRGNKENIMYFRSETYLKANFKKPTLFLDTDMLVIKEINENKIFSDKNYVFCERYYDGIINPNYLKINKLEKYTGQTWKQFCPYLGCLIGAKDKKIFKEIYNNYNKLDNEYKKWNGDQMALNETFKKFKEIGLVSEQYYAYPIYKGEEFDKVFIIHFKGNKKDKMKFYYDKFFNKIKSKDINHENISTINQEKIGRNNPCICGSGIKYKYCHGKLK